MNREDLIILSSVFPLALLVAMYVWWRVIRSDRRAAPQQSVQTASKLLPSRRESSQRRRLNWSPPAYGIDAFRSHHMGTVHHRHSELLRDWPGLDAGDQRGVLISDETHFPQRPFDHQNCGDVDLHTFGEDPLDTDGLSQSHM